MLLKDYIKYFNSDHLDFVEKHKALIITILISGTLVMAMFAMGIKKHNVLIAESYYELPPPPTPEEQELLEKLALNDPNIAETNKAYNSEEEFKDVMKNFKSLNSNDFDENAKQTETEETEELEEVTETDNTETASEDNAIDESDMSSYSKINNVLAMRSSKKKQSTQSNGNNSTDKSAKNSAVNTNSSVSYSLVNRKDINLPPPVYLCEESGKVVVNITVNASGDVIEAYINTSSTSKNNCLVESALEYAKAARFSSDASKPKQIGSITYYFIGKPKS